MDAPEPDYRDRIRQRLEEFYGRPPRYRYFQKGRGPMFCWTVEKVDGRYESFVYEPVGKGSRTGKAEAWRINETLTARHRLRKDAKARALRLHQEAEQT